MLTSILIFLPLLTSLFLFFAKPASSKNIALGITVVQFIIAALCMFTFKKDASWQFGIDLNWIPSFGIHFAVGMDGISMVMVLLTTLITPFIVYSAFSKDIGKDTSFYALLLMMNSALIGVFTAKDAFLFYLFWELALIPVYFICLLWGGENRNKITLKFFIYTISGSLLMLVAFLFIYNHIPVDKSFSWDAMAAAGRSLPLHYQIVLFWFIFLAFAIKMPIFPFHTWQPDTYTVSPVQGTMLLSAIMLKMGAYGVIRWLLPIVPEGVEASANTAIILCIVGIVYAAILAIMQNDYKRLIAYSSISHVGLIGAGMLVINVQGIQGAIIQMLSHGINVFALFYIIDLIQERTGTRKISELGGVRSKSPVFATVFMIVMLGAVALPLTNGFVGEFLLINGLFQYNMSYAAIAGITIILGAVYMLRSYQYSMLGETKTATHQFLELTSSEKLVLFPMVALILFIGVYPKPFLEVSEAAVEQLVLSIQNKSTLSIR